MAASSPDDVIEESHRALDRFVQGDPEPMKMLFRQDSAVTLANPFGPVAIGWEQVEPTLERAAANFREGSAVAFDRLAGHVTPDVAYVVELERYEAKVGGAEETSDLALRVTTVLRADSGGWKIVHRHADPITTPRSAESIIRN